jgi:HEAT repeat protein
MLDDPDWATRRAAAFDFGVLGDRRALEPLQQAQRKELFFRRGVFRRSINELRNEEA